MIAQELIYKFRHTSGKKGFLAWKIDLSKAYDKLSWAFIEMTLTELCIPDKILKLIMSCVSSTSFQVLVNGEMSKTFFGNRGIRQGDPLSPYLFVLCMEKLSHLIHDGVESGQWKPIKATRYGPFISHLFFADDLILFAEASTKQARFLKKVMDLFCSNSGQSVNFDKSVIYCSPNIRSSLAYEISSICGSPITDDLGKYLGMPILHSRVGKNTYASLIDKVQSRLANWKSKTLNIAGRVTLIQSVTAATPIYAMQTAKLPIDTCHKLDSINRGFLWGDTSDQKKVHLVNWNNVCRPKSLGGLGLKKTREMNQALLAKAGWRILQNDSGLWSQIFQKKYLINYSFPQNYHKPAACSHIWSSIVYGSNLLRQGLRWRIGNGSKVLFWLDNWTNFGALSVHASRNSILDLTATVAEFWSDRRWNIPKLSELLPPNIVHKICAIPISLSDNPDRLIWGAAPNGIFSVKSAYLLNFYDQNPVNYPWARNWKLHIPPKLKIFLWTMVANKLLTNIQRMHRHFTSDPSCLHCPEHPESLLHLFRDCPKAILVWNSFYIPSPMADTFSMDWNGWLSGNLLQDNCFHLDIPWNVFFTFTCWHIWKWRCKCIFDCNFNLPFDRKNIITSYISDWMAASLKSTKALHRLAIQISWSKPSAGLMKINVDGALNKWGSIGAGGLIRDHSGAWLGGFMVSLGSGDSLQAEAWGMLYGMQLAASKGCQRVIFESDSECLIDLITKGDESMHPLGTIISNCKALGASFSSCSFMHIYREANEAADFLAKTSLGNDLGITWLDGAPPGIITIIMDDISGSSKTRHVPATIPFCNPSHTDTEGPGRSSTSGMSNYPSINGSNTQPSDYG